MVGYKRPRQEKYKTIQFRKQTAYFLRKQFTKDKYDNHEPTTNSELQPLDLVQTQKECGRVKHVYERPTSLLGTLV